MSDRRKWITESAGLAVDGPLGETAWALTEAVLQLSSAGGTLRAALMLAGKDAAGDELEAAGTLEGHAETYVLLAAIRRLVEENVTMARQLTETKDATAGAVLVETAVNLPPEDVPDAEFVRRLHEAGLGTLTIEEADGRTTTIEIVPEAVEDTAADFHPEW